MKVIEDGNFTNEDCYHCVHGQKIADIVAGPNEVVEKSLIIIVNDEEILRNPSPKLCSQGLEICQYRRRKVIVVRAPLQLYWFQDGASPNRAIYKVLATASETILEDGHGVQRLIIECNDDALENIVTIKLQRMITIPWPFWLKKSQSSFGWIIVDASLNPLALPYPKNLCGCGYEDEQLFVPPPY